MIVDILRTTGLIIIRVETNIRFVRIFTQLHDHSNTMIVVGYNEFYVLIRIFSKYLCILVKYS